MKWLFQDDYIAHSVTVSGGGYHCIAIVLRHGNDEEIKIQFRILVFGLIVEAADCARSSRFLFCVTSSTVFPV